MREARRAKSRNVRLNAHTRKRRSREFRTRWETPACAGSRDARDAGHVRARALGAKPGTFDSHEFSRNKEKHRGLRTLPPLNVFAALENTRVCGTLREVRIRRGCLD